MKRTTAKEINDYNKTIFTPLCTKVGTIKEEENTSVLDDFLHTKADAYETAEERQTKKKIITTIFSQSLQFTHNKCALYTFGSYRLGVGGAGSDVDVLIIIPDNMSRTEFFENWMQYMQIPEIKDAILIADSFVPIIKCNWSGIDIDISCCQMEEGRIDENLHPSAEDDRILEYIHEESSVRSLNGVRVSERLLYLVPDIKTFQMVTRFVKFWAKQRGIYSNIIGYLGGISWSILVARVCQMYANATASVVLQKLFCFLQQWKWPSPVMLCPPSRSQFKLYNGAAKSMLEWCPIREGSHLCPILTPAYPVQNSAFNVNESTMAVMVSEWKRASHIMTQSLSFEEKLIKITEPRKFFRMYKTYLKITYGCLGTEYKRWHGFVESKLRFFIINLQKVLHVGEVIPWPVFYGPDLSSETHEKSFYVGIVFRVKNIVTTGEIVVNFQPAIEDFLKKVHTNQFFPEKFFLKVCRLKKKDVSILS